MRLATLESSGWLVALVGTLLVSRPEGLLHARNHHQRVMRAISMYARPMVPNTGRANLYSRYGKSTLGEWKNVLSLLPRRSRKNAGSLLSSNVGWVGARWLAAAERIRKREEALKIYIYID